MWTEFALMPNSRKWLNWGRRQSACRPRLAGRGRPSCTKIAKVLAGGLSPDRDAQFQRIALLESGVSRRGEPRVSLDTKARKSVSGNCIARGRVWTQHAFQAFDHDFPSWANGVVIPHGIYDPKRQLRTHQRGSQSRHQSFRLRQFTLVLATHRPAFIPRPRPFCCSAIVAASNSANQYLFKHDLQALVDDLGIEIRVRTIPATVRSTTRSNAVSSRTLVVLEPGCAVRHAGHSRPADAECLNKDRSQDHRQHHLRRIYETGRQVSEDFNESFHADPVWMTDSPNGNYRRASLSPTVIRAKRRSIDRR